MRMTIFAAALIIAASMFGGSAAFAAQAAPQGDATKGKANFERVGCYQCHGHQGQGGREGPRIADPVPLAWPALQAWVRTTSGDMPPYTTKVLSDAELIQQLSQKYDGEAFHESRPDNVRVVVRVTPTRVIDR